MDDFWKTTALVLITVIMGNVVGKQEKDIAILLSMIACCLAVKIVISYMEPVLDFLWELQDLGKVQDGFLEILIKAVGIALVSELTGMICSDAGNGTLGKMLYLIGSAGILYLSVPIFRALLTMVQEILGHI